MESLRGKKYLEELKQRKIDSRAYSAHQLTGLEIAEILDDEEHKSLYIKLVKQHGADSLLRLAKSVAERKHVTNKGAYFMKVLHKKNNE